MVKERNMSRTFKVRVNLRGLWSFCGVFTLVTLFGAVCHAQFFQASPKSPAPAVSILGATNYQSASTSAETRQEILRKLPFQNLSEEHQRRVLAVLRNVSMYRRLPVQIVPCDVEMFEFASRHPDVIVNIWELMEVSKMTLQEVAPEQFYMVDQAGTRGIIEIIHRAPGMLLLHVYGTYDGAPFPNSVKGAGVIVLQYQPVVDQAGQQLLAIRLDAFMQINNDGVEALVKTFQPLVGRVADYNLNQVAGFMGELSRTATTNGIGVANMSRRLARVTPEVQTEFAEVALRMNQRFEESFDAPLPMPVETAQMPQRFKFQ